jgi:hypothetical protein
VAGVARDGIDRLALQPARALDAVELLLQAVRARGAIAPGIGARVESEVDALLPGLAAGVVVADLAGGIAAAHHLGAGRRGQGQQQREDERCAHAGATQAGTAKPAKQSSSRRR